MHTVSLQHMRKRYCCITNMNQSYKKYNTYLCLECISSAAHLTHTGTRKHKMYMYVNKTVQLTPLEHAI